MHVAAETEQRATARCRHTFTMTPRSARRLLYGIVVACVAMTEGAALLRPAPPPVSGPQYAVTIPPRLPFDVPGVSLPSGVVIVPTNRLGAQSIRLGIAVPVHGLPGQVGAAP